MELLRIPEKMKRCGIKIKCLKCKWQVSEQCRSKNTRISSCEHKDQHRYNLVICVPNTKSDRKTKVLQTRDFNEALIELGKFKADLNKNGYQRSPLVNIKKTYTTLVSLAAEYLDVINGVNTPRHLIRVRSKGHISDSKRVIERFCIVLKNKNYNLAHFELGAITDLEVEFFHDYIQEELKLSQTSYNKHFVIMKTFVNWAINVKRLNIHNYFAHAELNFSKKEVINITKKEFDKLMESVTYRNGWDMYSGERRNYFKPWIKNAFRLALQTGTRAEELLCMKWNNIEEIEEGVYVFKIDNLKVNRIQTGKNSGKYKRYIPLTNSLLNLLIEMGYHQKKGSNDYILDRQEELSIEYLKSFLSRSFSVYIKFASERKIDFKDLRKTYITKISMVCGENTKLFTGHTNVEVLKNHYIAKAYLASSLNKFDMF